MRQHARVTVTDRERLVVALATDAKIPDAQGWTSYATMLDLLVGQSTEYDLGQVLTRYPPDYQIIGKAAMALRCPPDPVDEPLLLDALTVHRLPRLPSRQTASGSARAVATAENLHEEVAEAAARKLLGRLEEATGLVVKMLAESSMELYERLLAALRDAGLADAARGVLTKQSGALARTIAWLKDYDRDGPARLLDHLAQHPRAELTVVQAARLDELADLYETLHLHWLGGYPRRGEYASWLEFVDVVRVLGGFDPARLAAEADLARQRVAQVGDEGFTALRISAQPRDLDQWHHLREPVAAADRLVQALFMGKRTAQIAAAALSAAPPSSAIPLLEEALPQLKSSRDHQRLAAHAYARLKGDEPLTEWATSGSPALRLVAAERLPTRCCASSHTTPTAMLPSPLCAASLRHAPQQQPNTSRVSSAPSVKNGHADAVDPQTMTRRINALNSTSFCRIRSRLLAKCSPRSRPAMTPVPPMILVTKS